MSSEYTAQLTIQEIERVNMVKRFVVEPLQLYPDTGGHKKSGDQERNKQALLTIGALGIDNAYDELDSWLRFPGTRFTNLETSFKADPYSTRSLVLTAGRYAMLHADTILPHLDAAGVRRRDTKIEQHPLYRYLDNHKYDGKLQRYKDKQLQLAKISIFGNSLFDYKMQQLAK